MESNVQCFKILRICIYPTDTMKETYVLKLQPDGMFYVAMGTRRNDDINSNNFLDISISKVKKMELSEMSKISKLLKSLELTDEITRKIVLDDSWEVNICYNGKKYVFDFREHREEEIGVLIRSLIEYSPLKINIHGWS